MPLLKTINCNPTTEILLWKITESLAELSAEVTLNPKNRNRHYIDLKFKSLQNKHFINSCENYKITKLIPKFAKNLQIQIYYK